MNGGHDILLEVLTSRALKVKAAESLWHNQGASAVVSYLLKVEDNAVTVDVLPIIKQG